MAFPCTTFAALDGEASPEAERDMAYDELNRISRDQATHIRRKEKEGTTSFVVDYELRSTRVERRNRLLSLGKADDLSLVDGVAVEEPDSLASSFSTGSEHSSKSGSPTERR